MKKKELYAAPETEVLELYLEQAVLGGSVNDFEEQDMGGSWG